MEILHKNPATEVRARLSLSRESDYTLLLDGAEAVVVALEKDKPQYFAFDARQRQSLYRLRVIDIDIVINDLLWLAISTFRYYSRDEHFHIDIRSILIQILCY